MLKLMDDLAGEGIVTEVTLLDENNRPTPLLIGMVALELCIDVAVGFAAYQIARMLGAGKK